MGIIAVTAAEQLFAGTGRYDEKKAGYTVDMTSALDPIRVLIEAVFLNWIQKLFINGIRKKMKICRRRQTLKVDRPAVGSETA